MAPADDDAYAGGLMGSATFSLGPGRWAPHSTNSSPARGPRILLVRHGRTALNAAGVLRGNLNPELDATGLIEARAVADAIGHSGLAFVVSSPLRRALDTADHIAARAGLRVEIDVRLIDRDYAGWAGKPKTELLAEWGSLDAAPGVELSADVSARALDVFHDVARRVGMGSAVLVTHDAVLQLLLPALDPRLEGPEPLPQDTGCFNVVERDDHLWRVTGVNLSPAGAQRRPSSGTETFR